MVCHISVNQFIIYLIQISDHRAHKSTTQYTKKTERGSSNKIP